MKKLLLLTSCIFALLMFGCSEDDDSNEVVKAGQIAKNDDGEQYNFTVGDGIPDFINEINLLGLTNGTERRWLITDTDGTITSIFESLSKLKENDFNDSPAGQSLIWYLRYDGQLTGLATGSNANSLQGKFDLSNSLEVNKTGTISNAATIEGGPFTFVVGDGLEDNIPAGAITQTGSTAGSESTWLITDSDGIILGLPATLEDVEGNDFENAGEGACLIWFATYEKPVRGLKAGENANAVTGDFSLSNPITVNREAFVLIAEAGSIAGGPFTFTVGDGTPDFIASGAITQSGTTGGSENTWVITDSNNIILGLPPTLADVEANDFDGAGIGACLIWFANYEGTVTGLAVGEDATTVGGDFDLSNSLTVNREGPAPAVDAGSIAGGPFPFTVADSTPDMVPTGAITQSGGGLGTTITWVITDDNNIITSLPATLTDVEATDFDGETAGTSLIWFATYEGAVTGLTIGEDLTAVAGDFDLSNSITVTKESAGSMVTFTAPVIEGGPYNFTVGAGIENIKALVMASGGSVITLSRPTAGTVDPPSTATAGRFLVIAPNGEVLSSSGGANPLRNNFNFEAAGVGVYSIYRIFYESAATPTNIALGENFNDRMGNFALSNEIQVTVTN